MSQLSQAYQDQTKKQENLLLSLINKNHPRPKLITKDLFFKIPSINASTDDDLVEEIILYAHFFHPFSSFDWYISHLNHKDGSAFGLVKGFKTEWGCFNLIELSNLDLDGLRVERDLYFTSRPFKNL